MPEERWQPFGASTPRTTAPRELAELWRLEKPGRRARCVLTEHPAGCELRIYVGGELVFSQAYGSQEQAQTAAVGHRSDFLALGWGDVAAP